MNMDSSDLAALLQRARQDRFAAGFVDRVMRRLQQRPLLTLGMRLQQPFRWLVPAAIAAILTLGFLNARAVGGTGGGAIEAVLGLPPVTLETAYAFDSQQ